MDKAAKVHRGFNRAGIVLLVLIAVIGPIGIVTMTAPRDWSDRYTPFLSVLILAVFAYLLCRALGWIIAGFLEE